MSHLTALQCSMYADAALDEAEIALASAHLDGCPLCRERVAAYAAERKLIQTTMSAMHVDVPGALPRFRRPLGLRGFAIANLATALVVWFAQFLWKTLFGELVVDVFSEVTSIYLPSAYDLIVDAAVFIAERGINMIDAYFSFIGLAVLVLITLSIVAIVGARRAAVATLLASTLAAGVLMAPTASALELRHSEDAVGVAKGDTIDDTLILSGDTVTIDGTVQGDVFAAGRRVVVNGMITGNLVAFAERVTVAGDVGGLVLGAGESFELVDSTVHGDLWAAGDRVSIRPLARVLGNASIATSTGTIEGNVGKDLTVAGESIDVSGSVGEDVEAYVERLSLDSTAKIGGNVRLRTEDEDQLQRSSDASIAGMVEFLPVPEKMKHRNEYLTVKFYVRQLLRLAAAFLVGVAVLWLFPTLRALPLSADVEGIKTSVTGLVAAVSLPIIGVLLAITIVGLPFALLAFIAWFLLLYFAKIVVAALIGSMLLDDTEQAESLPVTLLVGLGIVVIAINIPFIGNVINVILTIVGVGLLTQLALRYSPTR
ncbi:MAG: hypothetical protein KDI19_10115 [Pseudomonadales bacterium]|nr:hypothetical protein [Pseudomonadales bacterium]